MNPEKIVPREFVTDKQRAEEVAKLERQTEKWKEDLEKHLPTEVVSILKKLVDRNNELQIRGNLSVEEQMEFHRNAEVAQSIWRYYDDQGQATQEKPE